MIIQLKIEKEHFYFIIVLIAILFVVGAVAYGTNEPAKFGHSDNEIMNVSAGKILPGTFNGDVNSVFIFPGNLEIKRNLTTLNLTVAKNITFGGVTRGSWPAEFPQGFCIFSRTNTTCPGGWTRSISLDGRTIRGWSPPGGTGGSDTHIHWIAPPLYYSYQHGTGSYAWTYGVGANSGPGDSWPPYTNVLICCKN